MCGSKLEYLERRARIERLDVEHSKALGRARLVGELGLMLLVSITGLVLPCRSCCLGGARPACGQLPGKSGVCESMLACESECEQAAHR